MDSRESRPRTITRRDRIGWAFIDSPDVVPPRPEVTGTPRRVVAERLASLHRLGTAPGWFRERWFIGCQPITVARPLRIADEIAALARGDRDDLVVLVHYGEQSAPTGGVLSDEQLFEVGLATIAQQLVMAHAGSADMLHPMGKKAYVTYLRKRLADWKPYPAGRFPDAMRVLVEAALADIGETAP